MWCVHKLTSEDAFELMVYVLPLQKRPREYDDSEEDKENGTPIKRSRVLFTLEQEKKLKESFNDDKKNIPSGSSRFSQGAL